MPQAKTNKISHNKKYSKKNKQQNESFGQLVVLGFDIAVFTPAPYQRRRLQRPSMEFSSCDSAAS